MSIRLATLKHDLWFVIGKIKVCWNCIIYYIWLVKLSNYVWFRSSVYNSETWSLIGGIDIQPEKIIKSNI